MQAVTLELLKKSIHIVQGYLLQEHPRESWLTTDLETYHYFVERARKSRVKAKAPKYNNVPPENHVKPILNETAKVQAPALKEERVVVSSPQQQPMAPLQAKPEPIFVSKTIASSKQISCESLPQIAPMDFAEMRTFFQTNFPSVVLRDALPDDSEAKAMAARWKAPPLVPQVILLSFNENIRDITFLNNVARAIQERLGTSAQVIEAVKIEEKRGWETLLKVPTLRLVIACHNSMYACSELMKYYREDASGKHTLGSARLCLLADLGLYAQEQALKTSLWKTLCQLLGNKS